MGKRKSKGLYVHIPFCRRKCDYCDFYSVAESESIISAYINAVLEEATGYDNHSIDTLYIGGGTPSLLGREVNRLIEGLGHHFRFELMEATVEANPESASELFLESAVSVGICRISIGVQSLNDNELRSVGRIHTSKEALDAINNSMTAGFKRVCADVIVGLPGQDWGSLRTTLERLIQAGVGQISAYCLSIEDDTPLYHNIPSNLPSEDDQADLYMKTKRFLESNGFKHIEISSFSLPGQEPLHNMNCWRGVDYIGLGAGASSFNDGIRYRNKKGLADYILQPLSRREIDEKLNELERANEEAMLRLRMLNEGLNIDSMRLKYSDESMESILNRISRLEAEGLVFKRNNRYLIPGDKILTSNIIFQRMLYGEK